MKVQQYIYFVSSLLKKANTNTDTATMQVLEHNVVQVLVNFCWLILITGIGNNTQKQKG